MSLAGKRIAITGIGGFLGLAMARHARDRGATVRGLDASSAAAARAAREGFEVSVGDVTDPYAAAQLVARADAVVHAAAIVAEDGEMSRFRHVNVGGTRVVAEAARVARVSSFVQVSSVMVYGFTFPPGIAEDGPQRGEDNPYCVTKIESDRLAASLDDPRGMRVTIVRPGDIFAQGSVPWVDRPLALMRAGLFVLPDGGRGVLSPVHVDDVVEGISLAISKGAAGTYNLSSAEGMRAYDYFTLLARAARLSPPRTAPSWLLGPAFAALARAADVLGREPPARASALRFLARPGAYSIARARRELGWSPRISPYEGLAAIGPLVAS
jgi:nucleoside-diphosphate-sugar epimerase